LRGRVKATEFSLPKIEFIREKRIQLTKNQRSRKCAVGCRRRNEKPARLFFLFKTWKVLGLVSQAQIKCWLANQIERSSKKEEIGDAESWNFAAIAQRLVKKLPRE
jgi:hypothetical protein